MLKSIHSIWAYLVVAFLIIAVVNAIINSKKEFKDKDLRISLFTLIVSHIQLLIGLAWYFMSPVYKGLKENGMGETMKDSSHRLLAVEHPIMMILAIVLITIGFSKHKKKTTDSAKFKTISVFYGIALVLVLVRIPWQQWF
jgi:heme A synthase